MCASIFVLTFSCTRGSYDTTTSTIIHGGKNMDGKSNIYKYKFLHISVLWQRGILRSICNKQNPARNGNDGSDYFVTAMQTRGNDGPEKRTKQTDRKSQQREEKKHAAFSILIGLDDTYYSCRRCRRRAKHNKFLAPE